MQNLTDLLKKRNELGKTIVILKQMTCETKSREILIALNEITKEYNRLMFDIYSIDNMMKAFDFLADDDHVIVGDILIQRTKDFIMFKDATDSEVINKYKPKTNQFNLDTRSDDEIIYEFILHNETNGIDCTKKFIESMLTGKISRARIGDTLTRLVMVGLNGKKLIITDANDLTISDKVYKII